MSLHEDHKHICGVLCPVHGDERDNSYDRLVQREAERDPMYRAWVLMVEAALICLVIMIIAGWLS